MPYNDIKKVAKKSNGKPPSIGAIQNAANDFKEKKKKRGRKVGDKKTTKAEDKQIMAAFHKMRPPGYGVDSRVVHGALPRPLKKVDWQNDNQEEAQRQRLCARKEIEQR